MLWGRAWDVLLKTVWIRQHGEEDVTKVQKFELAAEQVTEDEVVVVESSTGTGPMLVQYIFENDDEDMAVVFWGMHLC